MKIHFVFPRWEKLLESHPELESEVSAYELGNFRMASLGIPTAAAALPDEIEVSFQDQHIEEVNYNTDADLVGIGFFTPQASNAYSIADRFRERGVPTVAGGIHPTMTPGDTLKHFDSVVVGEVEGMWETILADLDTGELRPVYSANGNHERSRVLHQPQPRRSLFKGSTYLRTGVVQIARGCSLGCGFCVVPGCYGRTIRYREIADVIDDIRNVPFSNFYIADESVLFSDRMSLDYSQRLFEAMAANASGKVFFLAAYPEMLKRFPSRLLQLLARAGCCQIYAILGQARSLERELNDPALCRAIQRYKDVDIEIMASFTLGHDGDDASSRDLMVDFCRHNGLDLAEFTIMTPFPGTPQFCEMEKKGRLLTREWSKYNGANVVFKPSGFEADELEELHVEMWKRFYEGVSSFEIWKRFLKAFSSGILRPRDPQSARVER